MSETPAITLLDVFAVRPFTPKWNALREMEGAARTLIQHRKDPDNKVHRDGFVNALRFVDSLPST